ncbi:helix-turn-helix domain-containing protein [Pseudohoeflea coraliihabitans]|uniref:Helix-turn-helix domain-containing protein n=1 Tax=Pseudohoeflea coraliihabitans TaxID=2860393 RepID=A0ABS6WRD2_9HYPH|nr:helix-turn-helix transcriptional regulator [Pseudohoeflea sp. DP4N28-3]MBW3098527.1 helix-turn-helix domain-containing protein [Pseudohoeflea sp. DP4N28-3]
MNQAIEIRGLDEDTLGGRIVRARDIARMELTEVADRVGVTAETYAEWENDRSEPRANKLIMLAGVLGVSPAWLMAGNGAGPDQMALAAGLQSCAEELARLKALNDEISTAMQGLEERLAALIVTTGA